MSVRYPEVAAFDLDYTVWPCYCDTHLYPPFRQIRSSNEEVLTVIDSHGYEVTLYKDIPKILRDLKDHDVKLVTASRTWAPDIAKELLDIFAIKYDNKLMTLKEIFDASGWGERSKIGHLRDALQIIYGDSEVKNKDICLFDDESRNKEVERYGVEFVYVRDPKQGPTWPFYQKFLEQRS